MLGKLLVNSPLLVFPLSALFLFLAVFFVAVLRIFRRSPAFYDDQARLPLVDREASRHG